MWDFATEPEFQVKLDWVESLMRGAIEPLDLAYPGGPFEEDDPALLAYVASLKDRVREQGLWACHLGPELGGQGYGQVKLALLNEIIGRSQGEHNAGWGPVVFGTQAPDTGNAEIIAHYGTVAQRERYLEPLLGGRLFSAFAMTEPQGGSDPSGFTTTARETAGGWVIDGEKYFISNARYAAFMIVMAITDPDVPVHCGASMFLVPVDTPGIEMLRHVNTGAGAVDDGTHSHIRLRGVTVPHDHLLGEPGSGFSIAQTRLAGGRLHHAMRTVSVCREALDVMRERAASRQLKGTRLGDRQLVQQALADCYLDLEQLRLFVLRTAWRIDMAGYDAARADISGAKVLAARVMQNVVGKAMHLHGALGMSSDLPFVRMWRQVPWMGIHDGPTEVHLSLIARRLLADVPVAEGPWPSAYLPERTAAAVEQVGMAIAAHADARPSVAR